MKPKVLVVDDSPTVVKFVAFALKGGGFEPIAASDGMQALELVSSLTAPVDLVITDLNMPNLDGYSLIRALRENPNYSEVPIIILSSEGADEDREQGLSAGASSYLVKPFKAPVLLEEVAKYIKTAECRQ